MSFRTPGNPVKIQVPVVLALVQKESEVWKGTGAASCIGPVLVVVLVQSSLFLQYQCKQLVSFKLITPDMGQVVPPGWNSLRIASAPG